MDNPPPSPPAAPLQQQTTQRVRLGSIIRDVLIILALTFIGLFVVALAGYRSDLAVGTSNLLFGTVGFAISGCLAVGSRWRHLFYVAIGVWLVSLTRELFVGFDIVLWLCTVIFVALMMGLGGAVSFIFRKDDKPPA
jgi:hypothetical protein